MNHYPKPNAEDIANINAIIARVTLTGKGLPNFAAGDFATGGHYSKRFTGWKPTGCCTSEKRMLFDKLRTMVGMTYARKQLMGERLEVRLATCGECPVYHPSTFSCGRLVLDAIEPVPVIVDGGWVTPCGCAIPLKAMWKSEECPAHRWP